MVLTGSNITLPAAPSVIWGLAGVSEVVPAATLWPRFHHGPGGTLLEDGGFSFPQTDPPASASLLEPQITPTQSLIFLDGSTRHQWGLYAQELAAWTPFQDKLNPVGEPPGEAVGGFWGDESPNLVLPLDPNGNFTEPGQGSFPMGQPNPIVTSTQPAGDGSTSGTLFLRGELVGVFPTRGKARTAARHLNRFLARLPTALEISLSGMSQGISNYLMDAATGKGVDKKPVRLGS
jgi:hypothetical protein